MGHTNLEVRESASTLLAAVQSLKSPDEVPITSHTTGPDAVQKKTESKYSSPSKSEKSPSKSKKENLHSRNSSVETTDPFQTCFRLNRVCIFCGHEDDSFTDETLDVHYWTECPWLTQCKHCKLVRQFNHS